MKASFVALLIALFITCGCSRNDAPHATDDMADAKAAFATLLEYEKTDDIRSTNLFSTNFLFTGTVVFRDDKKIVVLPAEAFRKELEKQLALKLGITETYEDVKFSKNGTNVTATGIVCYVGTTNRGPVSFVYGRDSDGILRM